jgi:hypothetical protein
MESRDDLSRRVQELEKRLATLETGTGFPFRGIRKRASWGLGDLPIYDIAVGPDPGRGELRGHAKGVIAIGDMATGFLALGGFARGMVALGGLSFGLVSFGGLSVGILAAIGGLAIGSVALGGGAVGGIAAGGAAAGYYACGGVAVGIHTVDSIRRDPEAEAFFREYGLRAPCSRR